MRRRRLGMKQMFRWLSFLFHCNKSDRECNETTQDRHSSFRPEILKKRETVLADNMSTEISSLYGMGIILRDISSHIEEMYDVEISPSKIDFLYKPAQLNIIIYI